MANVNVRCCSYSGQYAPINGAQTRNISRCAVLRAFVTVGMQSMFDAFTYGWRGYLHRFGMGISALSFLEQRSTSLCLSGQFKNLDMSEKGAASYWYGMAFAKLVAESELKIPWLAHVDKMKASGALISSSSSKERADLVGKCINNNWHVIEAKGRSSLCEKGLIEKAKRQAQTVTSVNGQPPATASACITSLITQPISIRLEDPPPFTINDGRRWEINDDEFFRQYYKGIIEYIDSSISPRDRVSVGNLEFHTVPIFTFDNAPSQYGRLELGLLSSIYSEPERALDHVRDLSHTEFDNGMVGRDGIAIIGRIPDWEIADGR